MTEVEVPPNTDNGDDPNSTVTDPNKVLTDITNLLEDNIEALNKLEVKPEYIKTLEKLQSLIDNISTDRKIRVDLLTNNIDAGLRYDSLTNEIVLGVNEKFSTWERAKMLAHELTHLDQIKKGDLWIEDGEIKGHDIHDEVEAFQLQHDLHYGRDSGKFDLLGNSVEEGNYIVTAEDVKKLSNDEYGDLSDEKISKP